MKRKTTELEKLLIASGFKLTSKFYTGKNSDKTYCYLYQKQMDRDVTYNIALDYKREKVVKYGIPNIALDFLDDEKLKHLHLMFLSLRNFVEGLKYVNEEPRADLLESEE